MMTRQQGEALKYFRQHAKEWMKESREGSRNEINVIRQRNAYVMDAIVKGRATGPILDVGCGTGDLVCEAAGRGIRAVGVDFSAEMIKIARDTAKKNNCKLAEFTCSSIFDYGMGRSRYGLISANGFIEYVTLDQFERLLDISLLALKKGGSLVLGSRNRLFNLFSLNDFTLSEVKGGALDMLLREAVALTRGLSVRDLAKLHAAPLQKKVRRQLNTGIDVSVRYQYTPVQLIKLLNKKGFRPVHIAPIHVHGVIPAFKEKYPGIHVEISDLLQVYGAENPSLIPMASSFMIHAKKG